MASDNTKLNIASQDGGDSIRTILKTAAKTQVVTLDVGGSGAESIISATNTLPVNLAAETTKVIGTVNVAASQTIAVTQATASSLNAQVVGTVASGATDSGNPVKVGGVYNSTLPTFTTGQRGDIQVNSKGATYITVTDASGNTMGIAQGSADGKSTALLGLTVATNMAYVYNGSTWDRQRGDTTGTYAVGNVASGATDSGNPVKVGGRYNSTLPTLTDGQRGDLQLNTKGMGIVSIGNANGFLIASSADNIDGGGVNSGSIWLSVLNRNTVFNGTTWDRQRGDTTGTYAVGNAASGATDSGNPVKVGGVYNSTLPTLTTGQRGDLQVGTRGSLAVTLFGPNTNEAMSFNNALADATSNSQLRLTTATFPFVFNGTTWDRQRGDTTGTYTVEQASTVGGASFLNIAAGQATTVVKASAGKLYSITINSAATATNTTIVYDNASGAGTVIGRLAATAVTAPVTINYGPAGLAFANGLTIITATANGGDMTIVYK